MYYMNSKTHFTLWYTVLLIEHLTSYCYATDTACFNCYHAFQQGVNCLTVNVGSPLNHHLASRIEFLYTGCYIDTIYTAELKIVSKKCFIKKQHNTHMKFRYENNNN